MQDQEENTGQNRHQTESKANLVDLYEKMSKIFKENLERAGTLTEDAFEKALKESVDWAGKLREHYSEDISRVSGFIRRDWHDAIRFSGERTRRSLDLDRLQAGVMDFLSKLAKTAGAQLEEFAKRLNDRLTYNTGEITGPGTLQCAQCEQVLAIEKTTRIPPCPKCQHTLFRRSY